MEIDFQSVSVITDKSFPVIDTWYNKYIKRCQTQHQQYTHQMSEYETVVISIIDEKKGENS